MEKIQIIHIIKYEIFGQELIKMIISISHTYLCKIIFSIKFRSHFECTVVHGCGKFGTLCFPFKYLFEITVNYLIIMRCSVCGS